MLLSSKKLFILHLLLQTLSVSVSLAQTTGDIRLTGYGSNRYSGLLEVYMDGTGWGYMCGSKVLSLPTASVACRQLGLGPAIDKTYYPDLRYGISGNNVSIGNLVCNGDESHILRCQYTVGATCSPYQNLGIMCSPTYLPYSGSLRVVGGPFSSVGTLELYLKGKWQNICYNKFTSGAADSACRQLGYTAATTFNKSISLASANGWEFSSDNICSESYPCLSNCTDMESSIIDTSCTETVSLQCIFESDNLSNLYSGTQTMCQVNQPYSHDARMSTTSDRGFGIPEIYTGSDWSKICVDQFSLTVADVVCKHLGFPAALKFEASNQHSDDTGVVLDCSGVENSVQHCAVSSMSCSQFINLKCVDYVAPYGSLRLFNGSGSAGSLHLFNGSLFVPLCDYNFGKNELMVACRQLGFNSGIQGINNTLFGLSKFSTAPHEYTYHCSGDEHHLLDCTIVEPSPSVCRNPYDAVSIQCGDLTEGSTRIEGGNETSGYLQVKVDDQWGSVCGLDFTHYDAHVACREMGFETTTGFIMKQSPILPIHITSCKCSGFESNLLSCPHEVADNGTCQHDHDVFLYCGNDYPIKDGSVRLVDNYNTTSGRLEISYHGLWMSFCGILFDDKAADVACRQLGHGHSLSYCTDCNNNLTNVTSEIFFGETQCQGHESELIECETEIHYSSICTHQNDIWITCAPLVITTSPTTTTSTQSSSPPSISSSVPAVPQPSVDGVEPSSDTQLLPFADRYLYIMLGGVFAMLLVTIVITVLVCSCCIYKKKSRQRFSENGATATRRDMEDEPDHPTTQATNAGYLGVSPPQSTDDFPIGDLSECRRKELELGCPPCVDDQPSFELRTIRGAMATSREPSGVFEEVDFGLELPPRYEELNFEDSGSSNCEKVIPPSLQHYTLPGQPSPEHNEKELQFTTIRIEGEL